MNAKNRNKTVTWVFVVLISIGLLASVSLGYFSGFGSNSYSPSTSASSGSAEYSATQNFDNAMTLLQQGKTQDAAKAFDLAISGFEAVLKTSPNNYRTLGDLATAYFYKGNTDKAIELAKKALAIQPKFTTVRLNLAKYLYYGKNNSVEAISELKKIDKGDIMYSGAQEMLAEINSAKKLPPNAGGKTLPPNGGGRNTLPPNGGGSNTLPPNGGGNKTLPPNGGNGTTP